MPRTVGSKNKAPLKEASPRSKYKDFKEESRIKACLTQKNYRARQANLKMERLLQNGNNINRDNNNNNNNDNNNNEIIIPLHDQLNFNNISINDKRIWLNNVLNCRFEINTEDIVINMTYQSAKLLQNQHCTLEKRKMKSLYGRMQEYVVCLATSLNNGAVLTLFESQFIKKYRNGPFNVGKISLMMDECMHSSIGLHAIEKFSQLTRTIKLKGVKNIIPSRSMVSLYNKYIETGMNNYVDCRIVDDGRGVIFDVNSCITSLIRTSIELKKRSFTLSDLIDIDFNVESKVIFIAATNDGAKCTTHTGMLLYALKFPDLLIINEMKEGMKKDSFNHNNSIEYDISDNEKQIINWDGIQSMKYVGLVGWIEGLDNYETNYLLGSDIYQKCHYINQQLQYFTVDELFYYIQIYFPSDLKATWLNLGYGNGAHHVCSP
jgi:hypothetical protein